MTRARGDFWLVIAALLFLACLAGTAVVHRNYVAAEAVYRYHLTHVTFAPHAHLSQTLNEYAQAASSRLHMQVIFAGATSLATVNMLAEVVRRRYARMAAFITEQAED